MPSKRSSGQQPDASQVEFLIDRSLGGLRLSEALSDAGLSVRTLADVYGKAGAQETPDVTWLDRAAAEGWVVLCKDENICERPAELKALARGQVRVFCLMDRHVSFADQAAYFVTNKLRILRACAKPGPYLYGVYKNKIRKIWPPDPAVGQGPGELMAERAVPDAGQVPGLAETTPSGESRQRRTVRPYSRARLRHADRGPDGYGRDWR
jgi:hypothetical protein